MTLQLTRLHDGQIDDPLSDLGLGMSRVLPSVD